MKSQKLLPAQTINFPGYNFIKSECGKCLRFRIKISLITYYGPIFVFLTFKFFILHSRLYTDLSTPKRIVYCM